MFEQVKQHLFTITGLLITIVHVFVAVGFVTCWIALQVQVLGNDPMAMIGGSSSAKAGKR